MSNRRAARVASAVQEEVARLLRHDARHPMLDSLTLTGVSVNDDLSVARIRYLPLAGQGDRAAIAAALLEAAKQMRGPVGRALGLRHAPELRFEIDKNIEYAQHMEEVFRRLPRPTPDEEPTG